VLLVLPFVSLVQEKVAALSLLARETGQKFVVEEYAAGNGRIPPIRRRTTPALFIATIEKAGQIVACAINKKVGKAFSGSNCVPNFFFGGYFFERCNLVLDFFAFLDK
jgi:hypothetical protein